MLDEVAEWQNRPLDICYPLVFFDAIRVKVRDEGFVRNKAIYIALGILPDGTKEILGIWIEQTEGAKFWLRVMNELKNRGAQDILIAVVDGLKGFPEAINAVFPQTVIQTCIVHLIRHSMDSGPTPRIIPDEGYFSMPSAESGSEVRRNRALNCWPCIQSLTHSPDAVIHSPAAMVAAWPTTVTTYARAPWPAERKSHSRHCGT